MQISYQGRIVSYQAHKCVLLDICHHYIDSRLLSKAFKIEFKLNNGIFQMKIG